MPLNQALELESFIPKLCQSTSYVHACTNQCCKMPNLTQTRWSSSSLYFYECRPTRENSSTAKVQRMQYIIVVKQLHVPVQTCVSFTL